MKKKKTQKRSATAKRSSRKVVKRGPAKVRRPARRMVTMTLDEVREFAAKGKSKTDWARFDAMTDQDIERAVAQDPDAPPLLDEEFWRNATLIEPGKQAVSIRIDRDVIDFLREEGPGYQSRINAILRTYVAARQRR